MKHVGDITKLNGAELEPVDCITGGSPCQDLSVAGKRAGLAGERSGLFIEQIRIIKEMREHDKASGRTGKFIRPRFMVWENVVGAFSSNKGEDFRAVLEETARIVDKAAVIPRPEGGRKWPTSGCILGRGWSIAWRVHDAQFWGVAQRRKRIALVADFGGSAAPEVLFERKGLPGDIEPSQQEREEAAGTTGGSTKGAGSYLKATNVFGADIMPTLVSRIETATGNTQDGFNVVSKAMDYKDTACVLQGSNLDGGDVSPTVTANNANGAQRMPDKDNFNAMITYGLDRASFNQGQNAKYNFSVDEELSATQTAMGPNAVCNSVVRRLTPMECERLQGFPDGWTDIGEWIDSKGKKHKPADSPRYKALGNSIALPFWFWLLRRISAQYERPATLGSLFDGIGGFPLCWERCNGEGTARWASEIEEFPIAVTKKHFPE